MERRAEAQLSQPLVAPAEPPRDGVGVSPDARGMKLETRVACPHRRGERLDPGHEG